MSEGKRQNIEAHRTAMNLHVAASKAHEKAGGRQMAIAHQTNALQHAVAIRSIQRSAGKTGFSGGFKGRIDRVSRRLEDLQNKK